MVGLVRSANESNTKLDYQIDDMTAGPFQVLQFVDNDVGFFVVERYQTEILDRYTVAYHIRVKEHFLKKIVQCKVILLLKKSLIELCRKKSRKSN